MKNLLSAASLSQGVTTAGGVACLIYQTFMLNVLPDTGNLCKTKL